MLISVLLFAAEKLAKRHDLPVSRETLRQWMIAEGCGPRASIGAVSINRAWAVAVERPDPERRAARGIIEIANTVIASSGDYRHFVVVGGAALGTQ